MQKELFDDINEILEFLKSQGQGMENQASSAIERVLESADRVQAAIASFQDSATAK